jgi:hypothetical protein
MSERQFAAAPLTFGLVFQRSVFLCQINHGIIALVHVQFQPIAFNIFAGHPNARGKAPPMIAAGAVTGNQSRHQPVRKTSLRLFVSSRHRENHLLPGQRVALTGVVPARGGSPPDARWIGVGGVAVRCSTGHVNDRQLTFVAPLVIGQQFSQDLFGQMPFCQQIERTLTPRRVVPMLRAERPNAGPRIRDNLADSRILARRRRAAYARVGIDRNNRECAGDAGLRRQEHCAVSWPINLPFPVAVRLIALVATATAAESELDDG